MKISKAAASTARRLFGLCQVDGRMDGDKLRTVIKRLTERKPREYRAMLSALHRLIRLEIASRQVTVESAVELDTAARERLLKGLSRQYGPDLEVQYQLNPELLGGMRIRVGDDVIDGSVKGRLDRLAASF